MKSTICVATDCGFHEKIGKGKYRCIHPDVPVKKTWRGSRGVQISNLKECPK